MTTPTLSSTPVCTQRRTPEAVLVGLGFVMIRIGAPAERDACNRLCVNSSREISSKKISSPKRTLNLAPLVNTAIRQRLQKPAKTSGFEKGAACLPAGRLFRNPSERLARDGNCLINIEVLGWHDPTPVIWALEPSEGTADDLVLVAQALSGRQVVPSCPDMSRLSTCSAHGALSPGGSSSQRVILPVMMGSPGG